MVTYIVVALSTADTLTPVVGVQVSAKVAALVARNLLAVTILAAVVSLETHAVISDCVSVHTGNGLTEIAFPTILALIAMT